MKKKAENTLHLKTCVKPMNVRRSAINNIYMSAGPWRFQTRRLRGQSNRGTQKVSVVWIPLVASVGYHTKVITFGGPRKWLFVGWTTWSFRE